MIPVNSVLAEKPQRLLVVAPAWVGDMVMSQVIYAHLKATSPHLIIDILAPRATVALGSRMPEVNQCLLIDQAHGQVGIKYRYQLGRHLAVNRYQQAILTPNSFKSALVPFFAGIPVRTGFLGEGRYFLLNDIRRLDKPRLPRMVDRFLALAVNKEALHNEALNKDAMNKEVPDQAQAGESPVSSQLFPQQFPKHSPQFLPKLEVDSDNQSALITKLELDTQRPIIGICPGAEFGSSKQWPEEHYVALARAVILAGTSVWIFGSHADAPSGARISQQLPQHCVDLTGKTSLLDAVDLLALCKQVVCNDSGLMHVAAAVGARVIAIYGSTSARFTPPLSDTARIVQRELSCRPCFARECPLGHKNCLVQISAQDVLRLLVA